jgi:hypothetical protein
MKLKNLLRIAIISTLIFTLTSCGSLSGSRGLMAYSPLQEFFFASVWQNAYDVRRLANDLNVRREELISQCMQEAGFRYLPDIYSGRFTVGGTVFDETNPEDEEWVAQYGFGIVSGHRWIAESERIGPDPNLEYFDNLPETSQTQFLLALNGNPQETSLSAGNQGTLSGPRPRYGCWENAHVQAMNESPLFLRHQDDFAFLFEAWSNTLNSTLNGPEMDSIYRDWANCMASADFPNFRRRYEVVGNLFNEYFDLVFLAESEKEDARLELQVMEIRLALADFYCQESTGFRVRRESLVFSF